VQGERNETCFKLPSRRLSSAKIAQGERNETCFKLPSRRLSSAKVQDYARKTPILPEKLL